MKILKKQFFSIFIVIKMTYVLLITAVISINFIYSYKLLSLSQLGGVFISILISFNIIFIVNSVCTLWFLYTKHPMHKNKKTRQTNKHTHTTDKMATAMVPVSFNGFYPQQVDLLLLLSYCFSYTFLLSHVFFYVFVFYVFFVVILFFGLFNVILVFLLYLFAYCFVF